MLTDVGSTLAVREFRADDEETVLALLDVALQGSPVGSWTPAFFRWKHLDNPFGRSLMLVGARGGTVVGFRSFLRWRFRLGDAVVSAVRAVDTATHPAAQRTGVFSALTSHALEILRRDTDLVFNTPNGKSLPGYVKLGWSLVGQLPVHVRVRRPLRFLLGVPSLRAAVPPAPSHPPVAAASAAEVVADDEEVAVLLAEVASSNPRRLVTDRTVPHLRWRYAGLPQLGYHGVVERDGGTIRGLALFRVRPRGRLWETAIVELLVRPGDDRTCLRLVRRVAAAARTDHVTCCLPGRHVVALHGFLRAPGGVTLVANRLRTVPLDLTDLRLWGLSLGDAELF